MLRIDRTARAEVAASPARCLEVLGRIDAYPSWSSLNKTVEVIGPQRVRLHAELFGLPVEMDCEIELGSDRAVLRRIPYDADDDERYEAAWSVTSSPRGAAVELHVVAALDAPGPASMLRGRVSRLLVDDLLADFERALRG
jgi:hypothetical protein